MRALQEWKMGKQSEPTCLPEASRRLAKGIGTAVLVYEEFSKR